MSSGRDSGGRFQVGHKLGGRPKGILDIRAVCEAAAREAGTSIETQVVALMHALWSAGIDGDVAAARTWIERIAGPLPLRASLEVESASHAFNDALRSLLGDDQEEAPLVAPQLPAPEATVLPAPAPAAAPTTAAAVKASPPRGPTPAFRIMPSDGLGAS